MYGLINRALRDMVLEEFGEQTWNDILSAADVPESSFLTMKPNDDSVTFSLVSAASLVLESPPEDCLAAFGRYWVLKTAVASYDDLMKASGKTLVEFLDNLNNLHDRITTTFVEYMPPSFNLKHRSGEHYELRYVSHREGLQGFVEGLLQGLSERFDTPLEILSIKDQSDNQGTELLFSLAIGQHAKY